jgi:class 3 adenylate cyclase
MNPEDHQSKQELLEQAIAAQERLRGTFDDVIIDTTLAALRKELDEIRSTSSQPEQQRKIVSVLFVDVVDSTRMIQDMDPEESMEILDVSLHKLAEPVQKYGGSVNRYMGDGFLAVFGAPTARENDPEMAVRAGLEILTEAQKISKALEKERGLKSFRVRVGINTGLIAAGGIDESEDTIIGSTINLAARLEKAAEPGTVLVSKHTYQHIRGFFDMQQHTPIQAKGFPEPVETYKILKIRERVFGLSNHGVEGIETRMVGREREMQRLQEIAQAVLGEKERRFVAITGQAGLGKSRLLEEFESWLEHQAYAMNYFKGRAYLESQNQPYALFREMFAVRFKIQGDDASIDVQGKFVNGFREFMPNDGKLGNKVQLVGQLLGYDFRESEAVSKLLENPQLMRDRAFDYLVSYFREAAAQRPVAFFLDDIQWADESSLDLLTYLGAALSDLPILFIALSRTELFQRREAGEDDEIIPLAPLSRQVSEQLVVEVLQKADKIPDRLLKLIVEQAEGNPYYVEEIIRMLVEDGIIVKDLPNWRVQPERLEEIRIPSTLTGIIQARLDRLPKEERTILQQASVVGRVFWDSALEYINQENRLDRDELNRYLESLESRELVERRRPSAFSDAAEYSFNQAILREVTYEMVLLKQRKKYHSQVADWLIDQRGDRASDMSGTIANHLVSAGRTGEAVDYYQQAAESAAAKYAIEEAAGLYQQALKWTPEQALEKRFDLLLGLESSWNTIGERKKQAEVLGNLEEIANQLADQEKEAEALLRRAMFYYWLGDFSQMLAVVQQSVRQAEHISNPELELRALYWLTWAHFQLEDLDQAENTAQRVLELAVQTGDRTGEGSVHNVLGLIGMARGSYAEALQHIQEFLEIARQTGNPNRELTALNSQTVIRVLLGEYQAARDYAFQMRDLALETGQKVTESLAYINLAWGAGAQGDWQFALENVQEGLSINREVKRSEGVAEGLVWQGYILLGLQRPAEAERAFRESLEIRMEIEQDMLQAESMAGLSQALRRQGDLGAAKKYVEKVLDFIRRDENLTGTWEPLRIYWNCYQVLRDSEDPRTDEILKKALDSLLQRADKIPDQSMREGYLNNVPWHREIMTEWEKFQ